MSHQVNALETELAIKLFNRERQRLVITEAGRDYLDYLNVVRDALDRIAVGTERLPQRQSAGVLTVSTRRTLRERWARSSLLPMAARNGAELWRLLVLAPLRHADGL